MSLYDQRKHTMTFQTFHSLTSALIHTMAKQELLALNWPTSLHLEYGQQRVRATGWFSTALFPVLTCFELFRGCEGSVICPGAMRGRYSRL